MKRFKFFIDFCKEEKWLEHMAQQGWLLSDKCIFYEFHRVSPGAKTIRIDFREAQSEKDYVNYCTLFEDSGWHHIAGTKSSGAQYFLKAHSGSTEDIFSDGFSRAGRYKRLAGMWLFSAVIFIPLLLSMITGGWINTDSLFSPKEWYLTPGIWELDGLSFWWSFIFETPFALMRGIGWLLPIAAILICAGFALKSKLLYRSALQSEGS